MTDDLETPEERQQREEKEARRAAHREGRASRPERKGKVKVRVMGGLGGVRFTHARPVKP
jgi:hypothetical protein